MSIQVHMVDSQSFTRLEYLVGDYIFNKSLSTRFVMYFTFTTVF